MRESPALELMELIEARGAAVSYYDPFVPVIPNTREHARRKAQRGLVEDAVAQL